jgi:sugar phosphate isomerase/epimerase
MIVLDHLTAWELAPPALIQGAAEAGYDAVSLWFHAPPDGVQTYPIMGDTPMRRDAIAASRASGVAIFSIGLFVLTPAGWMPHWDAMLESGAAMGARRAIVLHYDPEPARAQALLAELAAKAADHGIGVDVEFIARSGLTSLADACDLVEAIGGDCGVILDPLHLQRTGGSPADVDDRARGLIRYVQLCDGPATMPLERQLEEGSRQRRLTGEGEFPLTAFVAALRAGVPIGLEIPLSDLAAEGMGPVERSRKALAAAAPYLALARGEG